MSAETELNVINPAKYSEAEGEFILAHLGEPPVVALRAVSGNVNPKAVEPLIRRVYELGELEKHENQSWVGIDAVKEHFEIYLTHMRKWRSDRRRGAPRFPSMFSYTAKGRPVWASSGADGGIVKTYFTPQGKRASFEIDLVPDGVQEWHPEWASADEPTGDTGVRANNELNRWECFCGHTETFKAESRASYSAARARLSKHMRTTTEDVERHREVYAMEFGG